MDLAKLMEVGEKLGFSGQAEQEQDSQFSNAVGRGPGPERLHHHICLQSLLEGRHPQLHRAHVQLLQLARRQETPKI